MKYLKKYSLFESSRYKDDIEDILLELSDNRFNVSYTSRFGIQTFEIKTKSENYPDDKFDITEIQDEILRVIDYLEFIGCLSYDFGITIDPATSIETNIPIKTTRLNNGRIVFVDNRDYIYDKSKKIKIWYRTPKINESNQIKNIITKDEFPSEDYISDFFFDIFDEIQNHELFSNGVISNVGYVSLSREFLFDNNLSSRSDNDLKNAITPVEKIEKPSGRLYTHYPIWILLSDLSKSQVGSFKYKFYQNIINGDYPSYPFIELKRIYFENKPEDVEILTECLMRLYEATGFRPVGQFHLEDFVDEDTGDIVTLYIANIKLFKVTDVEYKNLIKSNVLVDNPSIKENIKMTQKFL